MTWTTVVAEPSELGESPFWHPGERLLYWVDIDGRQIHRCDAATAGSMQSWAMPSEPGCIAPARGANGGGLVIALRDGIYRADHWGGALRRLVPAPYDTATTRFNDGKADPLGRFWAGTLFAPRTDARAELFSLDGSAAGPATLQRQATGATVANGLAWSPDARTLYWGDTTSHTVRAWDWDAAGNRLSGERLFKQWPRKPANWRADTAGHPDAPAYGGRPDGAAVDAEGNYHVAMFEGARLLKLSPAGELLADIAVPAQCPTMPCFGGDDLKTLYLTTARHGRPAAELLRYPQSGCVFSMRVEVPGLPVNIFAG